MPGVLPSLSNKVVMGGSVYDKFNEDAGIAFMDVFTECVLKMTL